MAEAVLQIATRYFCHKCSQEITPVLPDYVCPRCQSGFIEEVSNDRSIENNTSDDDDSDVEHSSVESHPMADLFESFPFSNADDGRRANEWVFTRRQNDGTNEPRVNTSTPIEVSSDEPGTSNNSSRSRGRGRRRSPRFFQFSFPESSIPDSQQTLEGIFSHILSNATFSNMTNNESASSNRSDNSGRRGEFFNIDYQFPLFQVLHGNPGDYAWGSGGLDAVISQLLNQLDGTGPPPMPKDEIDRLPIVKVTQDQVDKNLQCTVCMEDYKLAEDVKKLPCTHLYHHECIVPWLEMHGTCPICRKLLNASATSQQQTNDRVNSTQPNQGANNSGTSSHTSSSSTYYEFPDCD
ncbi:E3 ubiquitin-protein ligase RNF115-like isoform X1 [Leptotrombidium deliense]|uniref:RING-type E3 ubiquitin transferase n=1 Tax=Leptotrombidium deliense TaxID=299467 RepID=A0A443SEW6_9ACAR|nr:E3 ubiquitin-protein ligase RNF115-like isoform X1 [Leptotrombidium deliense]